MEKTTIDVSQSRFMKLESSVQEVLELLKRQPEESKEKELFTPKDFCDYFKCSLSTFHRLKQSSLFKVTKIGRRVYVDANEIMRIKNNGIV